MSNDTTGVGSYNLSDISSRVENITASTQKKKNNRLQYMSNDTTGLGSYNLSDINSRVENTTAS